MEDTVLTLEMLEREGFSQEVLDAVDAITKRKGELYVNYIKRCSKNEIAKLVKINDLHVNLQNIELVVGGKTLKARYITALRTLLSC